MTDDGWRSRRLLTILLGLLVLGGAVLLWSSSLVWRVELVEREAPLPAVAYSMTGADAVPMTLALGLLALAAVVAVLATGPLGRRIVGTILLITAVWTGVALYEWVATPAAEASAAMSEDGTRHSEADAPEASAIAGPLAMLGVALIAGAGLAVVLTSRRLPRMGSKYERPRAPTGPASRTPGAEQDGTVRDRSMWSSIDRGEDPTE